MDTYVPIYRGYTHAEIVMPQLSPVARHVGDFVRDKLVEREFLPEHNEFDQQRHFWRKVPGRWVQKYMYAWYNYKTQRLHVPIAYVDDIIRLIREFGLDVKDQRIVDYQPRLINVKMKPKFKDKENQIELISKCSDSTPGMKGLNLQPGGGKTYCATRIAISHGLATLVIVPGLVDQWIDSIADYSTARIGHEIYKVEGFKTLALLANNPSYKPAFFVTSTRTMQMFSKGVDEYKYLPWNFSEFFKYYGIGTKIIDECHKQFNANTLMEMRVNVPYNLYLSATFDQTSKSAREIFNRIFPLRMRFGGEMYEKYVEVHFYNFSGVVLEKRCVRRKGYMHALYEYELMKSKNNFNSHIESLFIPLINQFYVNRYKTGHKCLVFCSTVEFVERVVEKLHTTYPDLKISAYTAKSSRSVLDESDLVVSTIGKSSTGLDWKGLRMCLNTVSVRSPVLTCQMLGRLRKINGEQLIYVDVCDTNISSQIRHGEDRKRDLSRMASKFYVYNNYNDLTVKEIPTEFVPCC